MKVRQHRPEVGAYISAMSAALVIGVPSSLASNTPQRTHCTGAEYESAYSPDMRIFDLSVQEMLADYTQLRESIGMYEVHDEFIVDDSYVGRACEAARHAPPVSITDADRVAYQRQDHPVYTLGIDYDEE